MAKRLPKLSRSEKNDDVKRRLFSAAAKVVGRYGYADASVARITEIAGVAQGTFYNHFENRQELLDQLLPIIGQEMVHFIRGKIDEAASEIEKEVARFRAFFDFLQETPEFLRILNEAEVFAPSGYQHHLDNISTAYVRLLKRARGPGKVGDYSDEELEVIVHILMGARGYLSRRYAYAEGGATAIPQHVVTAYEKLIRSGLIG
ncbi:TetR/AcrR family transcriptional regulator [Bosea sp. LjRoot9]|uniref:TetR/AcrR family transcriptional regulator n=1 Tax=Bosea sp. LjRoot9 TaxID=3342341 RepID=UPI003ED10D13